jgi:hypothetical protein
MIIGKSGNGKKMNTKILSLLLLFYCTIATAQNVDCNRKLWRGLDKKDLPEGICIPSGLFNYITYIYNRTDINGDGLEDFICDWDSRPLSDGDTLYVSVYFQNPDSTFSLFKTMNNVYPIHFERYDSDYTPQDTSLKALLYEVYEGFYPFRRLEIKKDIITITIRFDAGAELRVTYKYDAELKNWRYSKCEEVSRINSEVLLRKDLDKAFGPTIDNFCYDYWEMREW